MSAAVVRGKEGGHRVLIKPKALSFKSSSSNSPPKNRKHVDIDHSTTYVRCRNKIDGKDVLVTCKVDADGSRCVYLHGYDQADDQAKEETNGEDLGMKVGMAQKDKDGSYQLFVSSNVDVALVVLLMILSINKNWE